VAGASGRWKARGVAEAIEMLDERPMSLYAVHKRGPEWVEMRI